MKRLVLLILLILISIGCVKKEESTTSCNFYEEHFFKSAKSDIPEGEKFAQRLKLTRAVTIKRFTIEMDLMNSQSVNFSVHKANYTGGVSPENSTLLGSTTITSSHVTNSGKVEFVINGVSAHSDDNIYLIIEPIGGSVRIYSQKVSIFDLYGEIWFFDGNGTWTKNTLYDLSFSMSGC